MFLFEEKTEEVGKGTTGRLSDFNRGGSERDITLMSKCLYQSQDSKYNTGELSGNCILNIDAVTSSYCSYTVHISIC